MEGTFTFTREDYRHYIDFWTDRNRTSLLRRNARLFGLLFAGYVVLFLLSNVPAAWAVGSGAFLAVVCIALFHWLRQRRLRKVRKDLLGERTVRITTDGVFGRYPKFEILNYWNGISDIAEDESFFFFFTAGSTAHVVPKRVFADTSEVEQFRADAYTYWQPSRYNSPMPLVDQIQKDIVTAMKAKDEARLSTLRMVKSALQLKTVEKMSPLDEKESHAVLNTLIKQRKDSIEQFTKGGRQEMADKEAAEIIVIESYLPKAASEADIAAGVKATIAEMGSPTMKDMGTVMKNAMAKFAASGMRVDGKVVSDLVKKELAGK
jgi:uncharacterized protein